MWSRRSFIKNTAAGCILLSSGMVEASSKAGKKITILHTNDIHSRIDPFPMSDKRNGGKGGFANIAAIVNKIRSEEENVLLLDAGDYFQGTPYFNKYNGELELKLLQMLGYDAITIGNHEFDKGMDNLLEQYNKVDLNVLSANYKFPGNWNSRVQPYKVFVLSGVKVGVLGLGINPKGLIGDKNIKGLIFEDPIITAQKISDHLCDIGCELIIALTHRGIGDDIEMVEQTSGIDLVIGGHTHTFLKEPKIVKNKLGENVLVNQVGFGGLHVGRVDFWFNNKGEHY